ncbi:Chemotaxis protein methyltransferase [Fundidesulfovibrio magnetotacticus]|uniref:protein-glutamate O-methyltransferase n=1 Tax=Fundidesulfovibrio magnetotacticus TaxID=2730080 RepID=A0A6V8LP24_9BACT|nr:protein-glutamate O-methyltransferase CheR [Fundidesulfovibrio magnetotacticus]GFK94322.1 Chemotaxis protein methyltransferase [Fundidesulfovibrio magnetotacticus]
MTAQLSVPAPPQGVLRPRSLTDREFNRLAEFIYSECGIKLSTAKKTMLEARLHKRLRTLGLSSYDAYCDYLFTPRGIELELINLIDSVTTNTTEFFREPKHFDVLTNRVLPEFARRAGAGPFRLWSAGCSSGEEPYTLSIVLSEFMARNQGFNFSILATDISTQVLRRAMSGTYPEERVKGVPFEYKKRYMLRGKNTCEGLIRFSKEIKSHIRFERLNFMEEFAFDKPMHVIFCRNVIIYFDRKTQENLLSRFCQCLGPGGHLFIGHSESITGMNLPLEPVAPTVYKRI